MEIFGFDFSVKKRGVSAKYNNAGRRNPDIVKIVEHFRDNSRKDIDKWRQAIRVAQSIDFPKFNLYHDLVDDLMTDGHLQSQIQLRKMTTLNTDFHVISAKTGDKYTELSFLFQQQWFYKLLDTWLDAVIRGCSLVEFRSFLNEKIDFALIPRRNVVPTRGLIYPDLYKTETINYQDDQLKDWLLQLGFSDDGAFGIINNIIPNLIWKRNVMQAWAEFCEKFGLPLITATTNTTDSKVLDSVHEMLLQLGEASVGTFPQGTEIKFQEANRTDAYNVYQKFVEQNSNEISKALVGSTMLSDQGTNRSQTEVHERALDYKIGQADKRNFRFFVNDQLIPLLNNQGYHFPDDAVFEWKTAEQEVDLNQLWNITNGLLNNGYEVEQDWITTTFNIPIEGKKKIQPAVNIAASYLPERQPRYEFTCSCGNHVQAIDKPSGDEIKKFTDDLAKYIFEGKDTLGIEGGLIAAEGNTLLKALRSNFKTFNPYVGPDHIALQMMEYNLFEFSASKTEARMAAMKELLIDYDKKEIRDFASFRVECDKIMDDYNKNWLETEYNLSVAVGQTSAQYLQFMAEKDSLTSYVQYHTAGDDRVRASHRVLNGKVFSLDDKEAMDLWPPNGYGCRCEMLQYLGDPKDKLLSGSDGKGKIYQSDPKYKDSQFEINRGDLKQVFTKKQFYSDIKGLPEKLNEMTYDKYGLKKWEDFKDDLKPIKLDQSITGDNVKELFKKEKNTDYMGFTDYLGRKMTMSERSFDFHTKGKYLNASENRHRLFPHIKDILNNPSEVWYYDKKGMGKSFQTRYLKFYNDTVIVIECELKKDHGLEIKTWYQMKDKDENLRKGLKVK